jgi:hypothetical protein
VFVFQNQGSFPFETEMTQAPISVCGHGAIRQNVWVSAPYGQNANSSNGNGNGFFIFRYWESSGQSPPAQDFGQEGTIKYIKGLAGLGLARAIPGASFPSLT